MKTLLLPLAGKSTRFPNLKPKWMLTHPNNALMIFESIKGLNLDFFDKITFIFLKEHEKQFCFFKGFKRYLLDNNLWKKSKFVWLDKSTDSQPETIYNALRLNKINGYIYIKDCDNYFEHTITNTNNNISYLDLSYTNNINPSNKSYIQINQDKIVENIIEKKIISSTFCVGGYAFNNAVDFISSFEKISKLNKNIYISDIVFDLILNKHLFFASEVKNYIDWGTIEDWNKYKDNFATLFVDIDGTLFENSSQHFPPGIGNTPPILDNIKVIQELINSNNVEVIFTTSRPEKYRKITEKQLYNNNIKNYRLIMGLKHSKRIIINDYSDTNQYPSCSSINLQRNSNNLRCFLKKMF